MKSGYEQFFKKAQKVADKSAPKINIDLLQKKHGTPKTSDEVAQALRAKLQPRLKKKREKAQMPWKFVGYSLVGVLLASVGLFYSEDLDKMLHRVEISLTGNVASAQTSPAPEKPEAKPAEVKPTEPVIAKTDLTAEEINHFKRLAERKEELDQREAELNRMEQELLVQKKDLERRLQELQETRRNISSILEEKVQADDKKVETLVQVYSNMKPQQAAKIFESMDEDLAIEILGRMKKKSAAEIMNLIKSEKAQILTEKYAGYKRD